MSKNFGGIPLATPLDIRLNKLQKEIIQSNKPLPIDIDDFIVNHSNFPVNCIFDIKKMFKDIIVFYRAVKKRTEPDIVLWTYIRDTMIDVFDKYGMNTEKYYGMIKRSLGYDSAKPDVDWQSESGKASVEERLDRQEARNANKIESQKTLYAEIPGEEANEIMKNQVRDNQYVTWPQTRQRMTEDEFYDMRYQQYVEQFAFNKSSDMPLVNELIMRELQLLRFDEYLQIHPNRVVDKYRNDCFDMLCKAQKTLGISREQRVESEQQMQDTLADLVDTYEKYSAKQIDLEQIAIYHQLQMLIQKYDRGQVRGTNELSELTFKSLTRGLTIEQAKKIVVENKELIETLEKEARELRL
jgi:hypothetical protein